jgi:hypothetical protein
MSAESKKETVRLAIRDFVDNRAKLTTANEKLKPVRKAKKAAYDVILAYMMEEMEPEKRKIAIKGGEFTVREAKHQVKKDCDWCYDKLMRQGESETTAQHITDILFGETDYTFTPALSLKAKREKP